MFGSNEIVGRKYFADAPKDSLLVTSAPFVTLQGEGPYSGMPAVFVRLAKCNLACSFCDTYFDSGSWVTFDVLHVAIDQAISHYFDGNPPSWAARNRTAFRRMVLVITGGEPTLQLNLPKFLFSHSGFTQTQIETNGMFALDWMNNDVTIVVSPKIAGQKQQYSKPLQKVLERADYLKFVVSGSAISPYHSVPDWAFEWRDRQPCHRWHVKGPREIFVSPMNEYNRFPDKSERVSFWDATLLDRSANERNHRYAAEYAIRHGLRFGVQAHLYGDVA